MANQQAANHECISFIFNESDLVLTTTKIPSEPWSTYKAFKGGI